MANNLINWTYSARTDSTLVFRKYVYIAVEIRKKPAYSSAGLELQCIRDCHVFQLGSGLVDRFDMYKMLTGAATSRVT